MTTDPRLADYKVLLPLDRGLRALVRGPGSADVAEALRADGLAVHVAPEESSRRDFDVVISNRVSDADLCAPDGSLLLAGDSRAPELEGFRCLGDYLPLPDWPAFRFLAPVPQPFRRRAFRELRPVGRSRIWGRAPGALLGALTPRRLRLWRRGTPELSLLETASSELGSPFRLEDGLVPTVASGRLGEGNPIVCFVPGRSGALDKVVKVSRRPGLPQLAEEVDKIDGVLEKVGPRGGQRVVGPTARAELDGRHVLLYEFERTEPFYGLGWRLGGRRRFLARAGGWLGEVARHSRHRLPAETFSELHVAPLRRLLAGERLPERLAAVARDAERELDRARSKPLTVLEHGDLGVYNVRLVDPSTGDFKVIDWGSSTADGIALGDLVYLAVSSRSETSLGRCVVRDYLGALELETLGEPLWMSYVARRWEELDRVRGVDPDDASSGGGLLSPIAERGLDLVGRAA